MSDKKNRALSWILLLIFGFVIFSSSIFIISHSDHVCTGDNCTQCMELAECFKRLHTLGTAVTSALRLIPVLFFAAIARVVIRTQCGHTTLISLKVELLN